MRIMFLMFFLVLVNIVLSVIVYTQIVEIDNLKSTSTEAALLYKQELIRLKSESTLLILKGQNEHLADINTMLVGKDYSFFYLSPDVQNMLFQGGITVISVGLGLFLLSNVPFVREALGLVSITTTLAQQLSDGLVWLSKPLQANFWFHEPKELALQKGLDCIKANIGQLDQANSSNFINLADVLNTNFGVIDAKLNKLLSAEQMLTAVSGVVESVSTSSSGGIDSCPNVMLADILRQRGFADNR